MFVPTHTHTYTHKYTQHIHKQRSSNACINALVNGGILQKRGRGMKRTYRGRETDAGDRGAGEKFDLEKQSLGAGRVTN